MKTLFEPVSCQVDLDSGSMTNGTGRYTKRFRDLEGLYADPATFAGMQAEWADRVVYNVGEFRPREVAGDVIFGVTRMVPGKVGDEFFLTRGHIHRNADRPELYYGQKDRGVMLLESPEGEVRAMPIGPMTACYVPPFWIHRSVNVGEDYGIIERSGGMRVRIVDDGKGGWTQSDNPAWTPRSEAARAVLYRHTMPPAKSPSVTTKPQGAMT